MSTRQADKVSGDLNAVDLADATMTDKLLRVQGGVAGCSFNRNGACILSAGGDGHLRLWSTRNGLRQGVHTGAHESEIYAVDVCAARDSDSGFLDAATGGADKTVKLWAMRYGSDPLQNVAKLAGHRDYVTCVKYHPKEPWLLASASGDRTVRIWDLETLKCIGVLMSHKAICMCVAWSKDGAFLASGGADKLVKIWDGPKKRFICTLKGHSNWVNSVSFSGHHKTLLASGGSEGDVRLWDVKRKRCLRVLRGHLSWVRSVEFCASTGILASGGDDRTVKVWDMDYEHHVERPSCMQTFTGHSEYVMDVAFNPAGMGLLASCSFDGSCKLWNLSRFDLQSTAYHVPTKEEEEAKKEEEESKETDTARMSRELEVKRAQHQKLLKREANETYTGSGGENAQLKMMEYEGIRRGAKQGNAEDLYAYGLWHDKGIVPELQGRPAPGAALELYNRAARAGSDKAMFQLGVMHETGRAVAQEYRTAVKYYKQAADLGNKNAMYNLGFCYVKGIGTEAYLETGELSKPIKDPKVAVMWWTKAAEAGHLNAQFNLGRCRLEGIGCVKDEKDGAEWIAKAMQGEKDKRKARRNKARSRSPPRNTTRLYG